MKHLLWIVCLVLCVAGSAFAATWHVEQDGTGDFKRIQSAVDASASGDTILIGPGFYSDFGDLPSKIDDKTWYAVASWAETKDLTFIGEDVESVVIADEAHNESDSYGGFVNIGSGVVRCENISFQDLHAGVWSYGDMFFDSCVFSQNYHGIASTSQISCEIQRCTFDDDQFEGRGIQLWNAVEVFVSDCVLTNSGFYLDSVIWGSIVGSSLHNGGNQFIHSNGEFVDNECSASGIEIRTASQVSVRDNTLSGGTYSLYIADPNTVAELYGNVLSGSENSAVYCSHVERVFGHGNHVFKGTGDYTIYARGNSISQINLSNNYWGTTDPNQVAEWIHDGNDEAGLPIVDYLPMADGPVPTENESWGSVKAMYRNATK